MTRRLLSLVWGGALALALVGVASSRLAVRDRKPEMTPPARHPASVAGAPGATSNTNALDSAWVRAPFRANRTAPTETYTVALAQALEAKAAEEAARQAGEEAAAATASQRPPWVLTGVIVGRPTVAIFSQVPNGVGTAVLTAGDDVGGFVVSRIDADSVVVSRDGQSWTFGVTPPWS